MYIQGRTFNFWVHLSSCALPDFVYTDSGMCLCVCVDQRWDASLSRMFWGGKASPRPHMSVYIQQFFPVISFSCIADPHINIQGLFMTFRVCVGMCVCLSRMVSKTAGHPIASRCLTDSSDFHSLHL